MRGAAVPVAILPDNCHPSISICSGFVVQLFIQQIHHQQIEQVKFELCRANTQPTTKHVPDVVTRCQLSLMNYDFQRSFKILRTRQQRLQRIAWYSITFLLFHFWLHACFTQILSITGCLFLKGLLDRSFSANHKYKSAFTFSSFSLTSDRFSGPGRSIVPVRISMSGQ